MKEFERENGGERERNIFREEERERDITRCNIGVHTCRNETKTTR